ncbi:hypothetical protein V8E53_000329 [Lactarius tabidus]
MPPKKTSEPPLSEADSLLLKIAARIFTAVKHKEHHPEENHTNFQRNMMMEMEHVKKIFADYPQAKRVHHTHAALDAAAWRYQSQDLSKEALAQPPEMHWWLPESDDEEEEEAIGENKGKEEKVEQAKKAADNAADNAEEEQEGEIKQPARRISKRTTKGKAPISADSDVGAGRSDVGAGRNTLRNPQLAKDATTPDEGNAINDDKNEKEKNNATPCDAKRITAKREYHVLVESPPHLRPKHCQRKNKASDAVDIPDDPKNADNNVTEIPWVGKGKLRCKSCKRRGVETCVPQWGALKPSKACTDCTSRRKVCIPPKKWLKQVAMICQELCKRDGGDEGEDEDEDEDEDDDDDNDNNDNDNDNDNKEEDEESVAAPSQYRVPAPPPRPHGRPPKAAFTNADVRKIKESLEQLTRIVLAMCKQQNINISNPDIVGLAPNTPSGLSPLGSFRHLSLGRGSCGSSAHSGGRSLPGAPCGKGSRHSSRGRRPAA